MPEIGRMTAGEAAAMTALHQCHTTAAQCVPGEPARGGGCSVRHVLFQVALAVACHNPLSLAKRMKERGKPHKLIVVAVARRLVATATAVLKSDPPWQTGKPLGNNC